MSHSGSQKSIDSVLKETRTFAPPATFSAAAHINNEQQYEVMWHHAKDDLRERILGRDLERGDALIGLFRKRNRFHVVMIARIVWF